MSVKHLHIVLRVWRRAGVIDWRTIVNTVLALGFAAQQTFEAELLRAHWNATTLKILGFGTLAANILWSQRKRRAPAPKAVKP